MGKVLVDDYHLAGANFRGRLLIVLCTDLDDGDRPFSRVFSVRRLVSLWQKWRDVRYSCLRMGLHWRRRRALLGVTRTPMRARAIARDPGKAPGVQTYPYR